MNVTEWNEDNAEWSSACIHLIPSINNKIIDESNSTKASNEMIAELFDWINHFMLMGYSFRYVSSIKQLNLIGFIKWMHFIPIISGSNLLRKGKKWLRDELRSLPFHFIKRNSILIMNVAKQMTERND